MEAEGTKVRTEADAAWDAARRRAAHAVTAALKRAAPRLEEEGVTGRMFSGLWSAAIGLLLMAVDVPEFVRMLEERAARLAGFGDNAQADLIEIPEGEAAALRRDEIGRAARIFVACLDEAYDDAEAAGIEEHFPDCLLDRTIEVLDREWGPWHLRRALAEQAALLIAGEGAVVDVREPVRSAGRRHASAASGSARPPRPRAVSVRIEVETADGRPRWAYVVHSVAADGSGFSETREAVCPAPGLNTARAALACAVAAMEAVRADGEGAHATVETSVAALISGVASPSGRSASDQSSWSRLDDLRGGMEVDWRRHVPSADRPDEMGARLARLLGRL